jgi:hypothetical protein
MARYSIVCAALQQRVLPAFCSSLRKYKGILLTPRRAMHVPITEAELFSCLVHMKRLASKPQVTYSNQLGGEADGEDDTERKETEENSRMIST